MTTAPTSSIDQARAEAFAGQIVNMLNGGALMLMTSIGHRTGLFDTMSAMAPATSQEIADKAGLKERYVREWLNAMTVGRIVEYDPQAGTYHLPAEHAASLTRAAGPGNLASFAEITCDVSLVQSDVVDAFRNGGGVPYSKYDRFTELMRQESAQVFDAALIDVTLPLVPGIIDRLKSGIDVADVACGAGHAINLMAREFPNSRFIGYDFSEDAIAFARGEAKDWGLKNAEFEVKDVSMLGGSRQFDLITVFDAIHDQAKPRKVLKGIHDSLKPGGWFLCADIAGSSYVHENMDHPLGPVMYTVSTLHCMTVSLALDGEGLGTMWGEQKTLELMGEAGFKDVEVKQIEGDIQNNYYVTQKK
jgi:ubiquinone/menaquinone biosynthesis C-methylase UbiE